MRADLPPVWRRARRAALEARCTGSALGTHAKPTARILEAGPHTILVIKNARYRPDQPVEAFIQSTEAGLYVLVQPVEMNPAMVAMSVDLYDLAIEIPRGKVSAVLLRGDRYGGDPPVEEVLIVPDATVGSTSVLCQGIDPDLWGKTNQAPLFNGKVNRWLLVRSSSPNSNSGYATGTADKFSSQDVSDNVKAFLWEIFHQTLEQTGTPDLVTDVGYRVGDADLVKVINVSTTPPSFLNAVKTRDQLSQLPTIKGSNPWWVVIEFAYRGGAQSIPWPTVRWSWNPLDPQNCPFDADWQLYAVGSAETPAPLEVSEFDKQAGAVAKAAADAAKKGFDVAKDLAGIALVAAIAYAIANHRK